MTITMRRGAALAAAAALLVGAAACSSDDTTQTASTAEVGEDTPEVAADGVTVSGVWARPTAEGAENGAVYLVISATEDDELTGADVPSTVAGEAQLHESTSGGATGDTMADDMSDMSAGGDMPGDMSDDTMGDMGGEMSMQQVRSIPVTAGEETLLEPGGYHVMLLGLAEPLVDGATFDLVLDFDRAGEITVTVEVRDSAPPTEAAS